MSYHAAVINVMIASPSDVPQERRLIQTTIHRWNALHAEERRIVLMPVGWETHAMPAMGDRPQEIINRQVLDKCDLLIAVFWTRLGSDTGKEASGTVEEIKKHTGAGKPAMIYFSNSPVRPDSVDSQQYERLKAFREECKKIGLIEFYDSLTEFEEKLPRHLMRVVRETFAGNAAAAIADRTGAPAPPQIPPLSEEAKQLLIAASGDRQGVVMCIHTFGGLTVQAGEMEMGETGNARVEAKWSAAVSRLAQLGLLEDRANKGEVFFVTHKGYELADLLKGGADSA